MQAKAFGCFLILCAIPAPGFALSGRLFHAGDRVFTIRGGLAIRPGASLGARVCLPKTENRMRLAENVLDPFAW